MYRAICKEKKHFSIEEIPEETSDSTKDCSEEKVSGSEKRIKGEMSHIQEISTLVSTSSKLDEK